MGLDMYLYATKYISDYDFENGRHTTAMNAVLDAVGLSGFRCEDSPGLEVRVTVMYWRKSNAIHAWFEDNIGVSNCQESSVAREQLEDLLEEVRTALAERNPDVLPGRAGFFFGSTEADEWYWEDMEATARGLEAVLTNPALESFNFSYLPSW